VIDGEGGNDTSRGLPGNDIFAFTTALGASNVDTVADYNVAADTIRLENAVPYSLRTWWARIMTSC
jgi:Ca2+-binding RTX toxin-like protein